MGAHEIRAKICQQSYVNIKRLIGSGRNTNTKRVTHCPEYSDQVLYETLAHSSSLI